MAEAPTSPAAADQLSVLMLDQSALSVPASDNSIASMDAVSLEVNLSQHNAEQRPATPRMHFKQAHELGNSTVSGSDSESDESQTLPEPEIAESGKYELARSSSPPPNCAICLGRCKNKCFTDSCVHQFCFKCLCEWSKVKSECPLCKHPIKSIIHYVKSSEQFEEYHVPPPTVPLIQRPIQNFPDYLFNESRRRHVPRPLVHGGRNFLLPFFPGAIGESAAAAVAAEGGAATTAAFVAASSSNSSSLSRTAALNLRYTPDVANSTELVHIYGRRLEITLNNYSSEHRWRQIIYEQKLFAMPVCDLNGRFRESSARFYRENPAQVQRLMPWISRELLILLESNNEHDPTAIMHQAYENLKLMNILSPSFRRFLQPILGSKTAHFIHELNNFARSPYDMFGYDRAVNYPVVANNEIVGISSSSSSDEDDNTTDGTDSNVAQAHQGSSRTTAYMRNSNYAANAHRIVPPLSVISFSVSTTSEGEEMPGISVNAIGRNRQIQSAAINLSTHNRLNDVIEINDEAAQLAEQNNAGEVAANGAEAAEPAADTATVSTDTAATSAVVTANIVISSDSSDECEFVLERKPPHLRTPELVSLHSDTDLDSDCILVEEHKQLQQTSFNSTDDEKEQGHKAKYHSILQRKLEKRKNNESPPINEGPSTSAGLRSTGRKRRQKSLDRDKRRLRREKSLHTNYSPVCNKSKSCNCVGSHCCKSMSRSDSNSGSSSSSCFDSTDSDSDFQPIAKRIKRKRFAASVAATPKTRQQTKPNTRSRGTKRVRPTPRKCAAIRKICKSKSSDEEKDDDACQNDDENLNLSGNAVDSFSSAFMEHKQLEATAMAAKTAVEAEVAAAPAAHYNSSSSSTKSSSSTASSLTSFSSSSSEVEQKLWVKTSPADTADSMSDFNSTLAAYNDTAQAGAHTTLSNSLAAAIEALSSISNLEEDQHLHAPVAMEDNSSSYNDEDDASQSSNIGTSENNISEFDVTAAQFASTEH